MIQVIGELIFYPMLESWGGWAYVLFSLPTFLCIPYFLRYYPEAKGKDLCEVYQMLCAESNSTEERLPLIQR